jgi:hypothetical protein
VNVAVGSYLGGRAPRLYGNSAAAFPNLCTVVDPPTVAMCAALQQTEALDHANRSRNRVHAMVGDGDLVGRGKSAPSRIRGQPTPVKGSPITFFEWPELFGTRQC